MSDDWTKAVAGHQRVSHLDGHDVNESYKMPSAKGGTNSSYMHPQVKPVSFDAAWKTADAALAEAHRPIGQLGRSKTVFAVNQQKTPGVPKPPKVSRNLSPGALPGPAKPTVF